MEHAREVCDVRVPPLSLGGGPWRKGPGRNGSVVVLGAVGCALLLGYALLGRMALLFQNLYQSTFVLIPGAHIGRDYWRSVDYGLGVAALVGLFSCLLLLIAAVEIARLLRPHRFH